MKRKFVIQLDLTPADTALNCEAIRAHLQQLGKAQFDVLEEVATAPSNDPALTRAYWVYVSSDIEEPLLLVAGPTEIEGVEIPVDALQELMDQAVCTEFYAEHPRGDRYGAPRYASSDSVAAAVVSEHFLVAEEGLIVRCKDRRDDGAEQIWLKVMSRDLGDKMPQPPAPEADASHVEAGADAENEGKYLNHYRHADCPKQPGITWTDTWSCMCNDHCPACGAEIEPEHSEDLEADDDSTVKVSASAYSDDRVVKVSFDCTAWFKQATHDQIVRLAEAGWARDYPADEVAEHMADHNQEVKQLFDYLALVHKAGKDCGFECEVSKAQALAWLKVKRRETWAVVLCEDLDVRVFPSQEDEIKGNWDWNDDRGNASETSFSSAGEAALNAVEVLNLESAING